MPAAEASFKNLILNMRCEATSQFLTMSSWKACGGEVDLANLQGRPCFAGLDLGVTRDMSALVLVFAGDNRSFDVLPFCWLPALEARADADRMPYGLWGQQGHLLTFPGRSTDPQVIAMKIAELHGRYQIRALAFDRWRVEDVRRELDAVGCSVPLIPWQGWKDMAPAVDVLERLVEEGKLRHGNHPVLTMAAGNAKIEFDAAHNRKISKRYSTGRVDPLVALCMALGVASPPGVVVDIEALIG